MNNLIEILFSSPLSLVLPNYALSAKEPTAIEAIAVILVFMAIIGSWAIRKYIRTGGALEVRVECTSDALLLTLILWTISATAGMFVMLTIRVPIAFSLVSLFIVGGWYIAQHMIRKARTKYEFYDQLKGVK